MCIDRYTYGAAMTTASTIAPAEVAEGVRSTVAAYCHALDDGRVDDLVALFTDDASSALPGMEPVTGREALLALYGRLTPKRPQRHLVVNSVITQTAAGRADAVSDLVLVAKDESGWGVALVGRYVDTLREQDGRWLFASRSLTFQGA